MLRRRDKKSRKLERKKQFINLLVKSHSNDLEEKTETANGSRNKY